MSARRLPLLLLEPALPGTIPPSPGRLCVHTESLAAPPARQGAGVSPVTPKLNQLTLDRALGAQ